MKVIVFHSEHCGPCSVHMKNIEQVKSQYPDVTFEEVLTDDEKNDKIVKAFGIRSNPTTIFLADESNPKSGISVQGLMSIDKLKLTLDTLKK